MFELPSRHDVAQVRDHQGDHREGPQPTLVTEAGADLCIQSDTLAEESADATVTRISPGRPEVLGSSRADLREQPALSALRRMPLR